MSDFFQIVVFCRLSQTLPRIAPQKNYDAKKFARDVPPRIVARLFLVPYLDLRNFFEFFREVKKPQKNYRKEIFIKSSRGPPPKKLRCSQNSRAIQNRKMSQHFSDAVKMYFGYFFWWFDFSKCHFTSKYCLTLTEKLSCFCLSVIFFDILKVVKKFQKCAHI